MSNFEKEFLDSYLKLGLGSMPKSDIDALVMHLLDKYGLGGSGPLGTYGNQVVSERLKSPIARIKKLRYDAALKYGGRVEDQAQGRLLAAISNASIDSEGDKILLIVEDVLARNWLQGQLKIHQHVYDGSFNSEIIKVSAPALMDLLREIFPKANVQALADGYEAAKNKQKLSDRKNFFRKIAQSFAEGAAKAAGASVVAVLKAQLGVT